jgi:transcriptional regulator
LLICCPECFSTDVVRNGSRPRENGPVAAFLCKNEACRIKRGKKTGRQFTVLTSGEIAKFIEREIGMMIDALYRHGAKAKTIAAQYGVSDAFVSLLRSAVDATIARGKRQDKLVSRKTKDHAVSIDETFFKIDGETIYAIIVRCYKSSKVLGINVSPARAEADMRKAFDEAQANSATRIEVITADAHEATRAMARHLGYPITLIVHPHKKPYDRAIIERIEYEGDLQVHTMIGVSTDIFKKQKKRQYHYKQVTRPVNPPAPKPRGRPKGSKNKKRSAGKDKKKPKKRGRPSIFEVFKSGKKGYVKVRPGKRQLVFSGVPIQPVIKGMRDAFELFAGKCIQNNHSESTNNVLRTVVFLGGQRSVTRLNGRIRAVMRMRNDLEMKPHSKIKHRYRANIYLKRMAGADFKADLSNYSIELQVKA